MTSVIEEYDIGIVHEIMDRSIVIKPILVFSDGDYENFEVSFEKKIIENYKKEFKDNDEVLVLAYNDKKEIII